MCKICIFATAAASTAGLTEAFRRCIFASRDTLMHLHCAMFHFIRVVSLNQAPKVQSTHGTDAKLSIFMLCQRIDVFIDAVIGECDFTI